jgi:CheY-like chemotaxis protein
MSSPERNATTARGTNTGKPKSVRVLVVDDNPDMRAFVRIALERAGFETNVAADGRRALDLQREHPADVLITDIFMPEPDGLELIQQFRSRFPRTKVIAISGGGKFARRHGDVEQHELRPEFLREAERGQAVEGAAHLVPFLP